MKKEHLYQNECKQITKDAQTKIKEPNTKNININSKHFFIMQ